MYNLLIVLNRVREVLQLRIMMFQEMTLLFLDTIIREEWNQSCEILC